MLMCRLSKYGLQSSHTVVWGSGLPEGVFASAFIIINESNKHNLMQSRTVHLLTKTEMSDYVSALLQSRSVGAMKVEHQKI